MQDDPSFLFRKKKPNKGPRQKLRSPVSPNTSEGTRESINPNLTCHCAPYFCHLKDFLSRGTKTF